MFVKSNRDGNRPQYLQESGAAPAPDSLKLVSQPASHRRLTQMLRVSLIGRSGTPAADNVEATSGATDVGTSAFGPTRFYTFSLDVPASTGLSGINVLDQEFPLQDSIFVEYSRSSVSPGQSTFNTSFLKSVVWTINITAAVSRPR